MILSGLQIKERVKSGDIVISPFDERKLNPNSYNVTLANKIIVYRDKELDVRVKPDLIHRWIDEDEGVLLLPGILYLGSTEEYTETFNLVPMINGRSSLARLGLSVHITAGFGDVGFCGHWTLEMAVIKPLRIYPGMEIAQIYYQSIGHYDHTYHGKYQNNKGVQASAMYTEVGQ
jgi:dCTP deaminase